MHQKKNCYLHVWVAVIVAALLAFSPARHGPQGLKSKRSSSHQPATGLAWEIHPIPHRSKQQLFENFYINNNSLWLLLVKCSPLKWFPKKPLATWRLLQQSCILIVTLKTIPSEMSPKDTSSDKNPSKNNPPWRRLECCWRWEDRRCCAWSKGC